MSYKLRKDLDFLFDLIFHFFDLERSNEIISRLLAKMKMKFPVGKHGYKLSFIFT